MPGKRKARAGRQARVRRIANGIYTRDHLKGVRWGRDALRLASSGMTIEKIAKRLNVNPADVRAILAFEHADMEARVRERRRSRGESTQGVKIPAWVWPEEPLEPEPPTPAVYAHAGIANWRDVLGLQRELLVLREADALPVRGVERLSTEIAPLLRDAVPIFMGDGVAALWERLTRRAAKAKERPVIKPSALMVSIGFVALPHPVVLWEHAAPVRALGWIAHERKPFLHACTFAYAPDAGAPQPAWSVSWLGLMSFAARNAQESRGAAGVNAALIALFQLAASLVTAAERSPTAGGTVAPPEDREPHEPEAILIRLRRFERGGSRDPSKSRREVDWTCQWTVREHFRILPDGRATLVRGHLKGPVDKPLRNIQRAIEIVR